MRRGLGLIFASLLIVGVLATPASASVDDYLIQSFTADYFLSRDEQQHDRVRVQEVIEAVFPKFDQNKGILRALPEYYNDLPLHLDIESVTNAAGTPYNYTTSKDSSNLVLKIGDPYTFVQGPQTYRITYNMRNVISFRDLDEFYWDVNGDEWRQQFGSVTARVHMPNDIAARLAPDQLCFTGLYGATAQDCDISKSQDSQEIIITISALDLGPQENLSFVLGFTKGTFQPNAADKRNQQAKAIVSIIGLFVLPTITLLWIIHRWWKFGRDPKGKGIIIPQYQPLKELTVLKSSVVMKEKLENKAISASIVDLAIRKYLKIHSIKKKGLFSKEDYEIEVVREPAGLSEEELEVLDMFFTPAVVPGAKVKVSELNNKLSSDAQALNKSITSKLFHDGYFNNDPHKVHTKYLKVGGILITLGMLSISFGVAAGFLGIIILVNLVASGFIALLFASRMPGKSLKGVEARDYLLGLREYIELAEKDRIKFLQSPQAVRQYGDPTKPKNQIKLFEELLPYAMLFGLEKDWAKQFKDLYTAPPDWYGGDFATFNAVYLASSLGNFSNASGANFSPPRSSGSSGFSSGGGFSGGGGGGGW